MRALRSDGRYGRSTHIVLNPATEKVIHLVVKEEKHPGRERMVPIRWIKESTPDLILLNRTLAETQHFALFNLEDFVRRDVPHYAREPELKMLWPYVVPAKRLIAQKYRQIKPGQRAVRRWSRVMAADGRIGQIDEFITDPESGYISHMVLREGLPWDRKQITIPVSQIARIEEDAVYLKLDRKTVRTYPAVPRKRR